MYDKINYIPLKWSIEKHDMIINISGGLHGIAEESKDHLSSILSFMQDNHYYPSFIEKLSFLTYAIAKDHIFIDGNKRTAIALGAYFLVLNGYDALVHRYMQEMENYVVWVMEKRLTREDLIDKITYIILDIDETEDFKLNIIAKLNK